MDEGLKHKRMWQVLKTEQEKHSSPRPSVHASEWDSMKSDTESLTQKKVQLQMCINQDKYLMLQQEKADSLKHQDGEDEGANYDQSEDLQVYDSLEDVAHPHAKKNSTLLQEILTDRREETSQLLSDDANSDLRFDHNLRTNLKGSGSFNESPQISVKEYYQVPKEKSSQCGNEQELVMKGGYRYIVSTSPAVGLTPHMADNLSDLPYHLHPEDYQNGSVSSPHCHNHVPHLRSPEADLSRSSSIFTKNESDKTLQRGFRKMHENSCDSAGENINGSPELAEDVVHATNSQELKGQLRNTQVRPTQARDISTSAFSIPTVLSNKKPERLTENIVERNKITLGCNTSKCDSYVMVHALKQDMPHNRNKVIQISKGKKAQRTEFPDPPQQQQPLASWIEAEQRDCLSPPMGKTAAVTQSKLQETALSKHLPHAFHLSVNLNTSSHLFPILQQKGEDSIISMSSLCGCRNWCSASEVELALFPGYKQANPEKTSHMSWKGINAQLHNRILESNPGQWKRTTASKCPLSCREEGQNWSANEVHIKQFPQNLPRTPTTTSPLGLGPCTVLPPIRKPMTGKESELSPSQSVNTAYPVRKSSSDGYLGQMEKQKLRARVTYKCTMLKGRVSSSSRHQNSGTTTKESLSQAYNLEDYKQLKSDINLQGLGPDYNASGKTKMKRQKLYSNVIREQNKKINRIPFLLAKNLEGNDKKVPRMKALEYARTIAKPPVQPQPKQRRKHQTEGSTKHVPYFEGLDMSQPATLDVLRKRHEEEKKAVAQFRKVHAV